MHRCVKTVVGLVCAAGVLIAPRANATANTALDLVPMDAIAFVIVPNAKKTNDDLQQCLERMNRPETAFGGRPIDQMKALLGVSVAFDDNGSIALVALPPLPEGESDRLLGFVPTTDAKGFLSGNFTPLPDVSPDAYRRKDGTTIFAKGAGTHVVLSNDRATLEAFKPGASIATAVRVRLGARGSELLDRGDIVAWGGSQAVKRMVERASLDGANGPIPATMPFAAQIGEAHRRALALLEGLDNGLIAIEVDPLGIGIRTFARARDGSELAALTAGGTNRGGTLDRLPQQRFYLAFRVDVDGAGGTSALNALLKHVPGEPSLPGWLAASKDRLHAIQMAIFPSKLGIAAGGILNDALLFLETDAPDVVRGSIRDAVMAMEGESHGVRRAPNWEANRTLKSGETTDAFEVVETVTQTGNAGDLAIRRGIAHAIFGGRGFVGFVKQTRGGVAMTFSQRADVLERATNVGQLPGAGGRSLADDATIKAYRSWLIDRADIEGFIGVGQFGKLLQQIASMVGGVGGVGGDQPSLPQIPASVEPIAFALEIDKGTVESALVIPSGVLGVFFDAAKQQAGAPAAPVKKAE